ncbi:YciI family protein [Blastococcus sp. SYSU DS1024]
MSDRHEAGAAPQEAAMAQYLLNIVQPVGEVPPPENLEPVMKELAALNEEMQAAGVWVFAAALHQPEASTVVRAEGGDLLVTDGPYAEAKEFVGGFDLIEVGDLDEALVWAGKLARVLGGLPVEVRLVAQAF